MNTHYIPCLLLRKFATENKVNAYDFKRKQFITKKLKNTFVEKDLFDPELEEAFAKKLEGPFGDLLSNTLLCGDGITIDRRANLLIRKFLMINFLRAPIVNTSWDEMVEWTQTQDYPAVKERAFLLRHHPEMKEILSRGVPSKDTYFEDLKRAMEVDSLEEIVEMEMKRKKGDFLLSTLEMAARNALVSTIAFWDCRESGQEFILPKLPGISYADQMGPRYKLMVVRNLRDKKEKEKADEVVMREIERLEYGCMMFSDNFSMFPLSPTRILIRFAPYFRAFFPVKDTAGILRDYPPLFQKEQFDRHFYKPMRMELFEPCKSILNKEYQYSVKKLTADETMFLNTILLDMETEEFVFHDFNRIRESFWYYDKKAEFANKKKHDFSHWC